MKRTCSYLLATIIVVSAVFSPREATAQTPLCPADYSHRMILQDPVKYEKMKQDMEKIKANMQMNQQRSVPDTLKVIPIVVHVLHDNGKGALTKADIIAGINKMNIDLRRLNADTTGVRSFYKPLISDLKVEMRLAQLDPNGNCTDGILYYNTPYTYNVSDTCKWIAQWPPDKYFNFWIVNSIDPSPWGLSGTIAGYEKFPWFGINNKYGAVVAYPYWYSSGRTLTHEVGHCLGLWHMWQDQSKNNWGDGCSFIVGNDCTDNDDMVCDTPPMYQPNSGCDFNANSCNNDSIGPSPYPADTLDMVENFMSYSTCKYMFTAGQKDRVIGVFGTYPELQNLVSYSNLLASGTNDGYVPQLCKPKAEFMSNRKMVCKGGTIGFSDVTRRGTPSSWKWEFPGGTPASSTAQNPIITYNSAGSYDVKFISTNATGSDTIELKKYVTVSDNAPKYSAVSYLESFEDSSLVYNDWQFITTAGLARWKRVETAGYTGNTSIMVANLTDTWYNELTEIISPSYDISSVTTPEMTFKVAYAQYDSTSTDYLKVYASTDCGATWSLKYSKNSSLIKTVPDQTSFFTPSAQNQWKEEKINLNTYSSRNNVRFKFQFVPCNAIKTNGNNIYIDDINIRQATGIEENSLLIGQVELYPNPTVREANLNFTTKESIYNVKIALYDVLGRMVTEISNTEKLMAGTHHYKIATVNALNPGIYFVKMTSQSLQWTKKLIVE